MIDENILDKNRQVPTMSIILNQLTSSQTIRATLVLLSMGAMLIMVLTGREIPDTVTAILFAVVGYYFGEAAPRPTPPRTSERVESR